MKLQRLLSVLLALTLLLGCLALPAAAEEPHTFTDISGHWAEADIEKAFELGLMNGVSETEFAPNQPMTRAMFVTVLYRLDSVVRPDREPVPENADNPFEDVPAGEWFTEAVLWARETGVVNGTGEKTFSPTQACARQQAVTMIYRYLRWLGRTLQETTYLGQFRDTGKISEYALVPMIWSVAVGLLKGTDAKSLSPTGTMTRAQFATLSLRVLAYLGGTLEAPAQVLVPGPVQTSTEKLFVDGQAAPTVYKLNGLRYLSLADLVKLGGGAQGVTIIQQGLRKVEATVFGKKLTLYEGLPAAWVNGVGSDTRGPALYDGGQWYFPASILRSGFRLSELEDTKYTQTFYTSIVRNDGIPTGCKVPVLMYHAVSDDLWGSAELFVSPSDLEAQIKAMLNAGCTPITFEDLDHVDKIQKPVLLTFDDGYLDNYTNLYPLLKKYNVKATIFVIVDAIGNNRSMTKAQIKELSDSGLVSIQSHTMTHEYLDLMDKDRLIYENYQSMLELTRITGKQPFVLCYPTGRSSALSRQITEYYYEFGLCMGGPVYVTGSDPYLIYRYYIPRGLPLSTFMYYVN